MSEPDLNRILKGDVDTWNEAYPWFYPTAYAVARNKLTNPPADYPADVEDVAVESITQLIKRAPELKPPPAKIRELKALLARITANYASDFLKKKMAQKRPDEVPFEVDEETDVTIEPPDPNPSPDSSKRDMLGLIDELADQLDPIEMEIYEDFHKLGLKYREISEKRGIPIGSVGVLLMKIHEKLRKMLRKLGE